VLDSKGKKGFFCSNRPGGLGSDDIYACKLIDDKSIAVKTNKSIKNLIPCPPEDTLVVTISGLVKDKQSMKPLSGATIFLLNTQTGKAKVLKTDSNGRFKSTASKGILYVCKGMENTYLSDCMNFKFEITDTSHYVAIPRDIILDRLEVSKIINVGSMDYSVENIYFDFNKWIIRPEAAKELDKLVQMMKEHPVTVEIGSYTDSRGSNEFNIYLSQKRAESAMSYMITHGIDASRITAKGYGESKLVNHCMDGIPCSPREHQANRRTEFKVTGFTKAELESEYDMSKFKSDEEIPEYLLDHDFFIDCLKDRRLAKSTTDMSNAPTMNEYNVQSVSKAPAKELKPVNEAKPANTEKQVAAEKQVKKEEPVLAKKNEKEPAPAKETVSKTPGDVTYRVQIFALTREKSLLDPEFDELQDLQMYIEGGIYKYTTGIFTTHAEAVRYRNVMVRAGFDDAFVVTFANGKRIYISPAY